VDTLRSRKNEPATTGKKALSRWSTPLWQRLRSLRTWLELLVPIVIGASLWFFIESHF
jgi:hypothetical protein